MSKHILLFSALVTSAAMAMEYDSPPRSNQLPQYINNVQHRRAVPRRPANIPTSALVPGVIQTYGGGDIARFFNLNQPDSFWDADFDARFFFIPKADSTR